MNFRTEYNPEISRLPLNPVKGAVLLGSCFSNSIGTRMRDCMWPALPNPCGVLYNPISVANVLELACCTDSESREKIVEENLTSLDDIWYSWLMDSSASGGSELQTKVRVIHALQRLEDGLKNAELLIVTFGTAWCYHLSERPESVVANCHKYPSDNFLRRRLSIDEIVSRWKSLITRLQASHPNLRIIFTVSPIRHLKDGMEGNTRSKAILQLACEELCEHLKGVEYFPAYEILLDDLRDYRFYATDMAHPSSQAVEYIWDKFCTRYLTPDSKKLLAEGNKIVKSLRHRPILTTENAAGAEKFAQFKERTLASYRDFISRHPSCLLPDDCNQIL